MFSDLREVFAKANEEKSGDQLAVIAARSERERVAAKRQLADLVPYCLSRSVALASESPERSEPRSLSASSASRLCHFFGEGTSMIFHLKKSRSQKKGPHLPAIGRAPNNPRLSHVEGSFMRDSHPLPVPIAPQSALA